MDAVTLRRAFKFGDGTRLDRKSRGIGRFGMGLPNSSISQCRRVDSWSWTNGPENAMHCYLSLDEIASGTRDVPQPVPEPVPERWKAVSETASAPSGTLVVWSTLDRVRWHTGGRTLDRTAELCGRLYRKLLTSQDKPIEIRLKMAMQTEDGGLNLTENRPCRPNDPLYLIAPSATPPPFDNVEMFHERSTQTNGRFAFRTSTAPFSPARFGRDARWPNQTPSIGACPRCRGRLRPRRGGLAARRGVNTPGAIRESRSFGQNESLSSARLG